ncbi:MAG: phytanoyl-CoA dioxygenase family protein [bacterium]|jgi:phytanoyl-CoA hydroxylase|nr:phytanoyl-CoA dioxygenase family protein [bacterium]
MTVTDAQWKTYDEQGFLKLGKVVSDASLRGLQERIDEIMLGKSRVGYDRMMMQLDSDTGKYGDIGPQTNGLKTPTLNYRKIQGLEFDPIFLEYVQDPMFKAICARIYGPKTRIASFRSMFMNKPARKGTVLPWHQDRWSTLDRDPLLTVYTALDPATTENGCVQIIPGSHKLGLINPDHPSGFLTPEQAETHCRTEDTVYLELEAGEVALLHNWTLHSSDVNRSDRSRRAFSVSYMDADTVNTHKHALASDSVLFGEGALTVENALA